VAICPREHLALEKPITLLSEGAVRSFEKGRRISPRLGGNQKKREKNAS